MSFVGVGAWGTANAGAIGAAALGAGASWLGSQGGAFGEREGEFSDARWLQNPEYPEAEGARETWWDKLQKWGNQPGYGAISPEWDDIWGQASDRISQYYWGGPGGQPGLSEKVKSSAAARGVSESPALETQLSRMGYQEASDQGGLATEMATKEAEFGEQGRQNWLKSLQSLSKQKPAGQWQFAGADQPSAAAGMLGEAVGSLDYEGMIGGAGDWLSDLFGGGNSGGIASGGTFDLGSSYSNRGYDDAFNNWSW